MGKSNKKFIIKNFVHPKHAKVLIKFFEDNAHLCYDDRPFHAERNIHYQHIPDEYVKNILLYYARKNEIFIDHYYSVRVGLWQQMRLCRWKKGHKMALHVDRRINHNDIFDYSSLVYLNDNYKGGELFFLENKKEKKYKLKALSCMIFPSGEEYQHGVKEVLKGKRYTIPSWYSKIDRLQENG